MWSAREGLQYSIGEPTDHEQWMLELVNRARADARAEAERLATTTDPEILQAYAWFGVDLATMQAQFATLPQSLPPLSFHSGLLEAARGHSQDMLANGFQAHEGSSGLPFTARIDAVGFPWTALGENIFSTVKSVPYGHAAFEVDWGTGSGGMQQPPGHRNNIHSNAWREIGIGVAVGNGPNDVGPLVVTQDFASREGDPAFVTGVAYLDVDGSGTYGLGEGLGDVLVDVSGAAQYAVSTASGGYSVPLPGNGSFDVTFSFPGGAPVVRQATVVGLLSQKVDLALAYSPPVLAVPARVTAGTEETIPFTAVPAATGYVLRTGSLVPASFVEGAEDGASDVTIVAGPGHQVISAATSHSGANAFHLCNPDFADESVVLERRIIPSPRSELRFASRLGFATPAQVARVQVSTDEGASWQSVYSQVGGDVVEFSFEERSVSLASFAGSVIRVRFLFEFTSGSAFTQTDVSVGFHVDDIRVSDADEIVGTADTALGETPEFVFAPDSPGRFFLQVAAKNRSREFPFGPGATLEVVPALDADGDGVSDASDNCPHAANPAQDDVGGVGLDSAPDGIGDACQCGDVNDDGRVTGLDGALVKRAALGLAPFPGGVGDLPAPRKCDVGGTAGCTGLDGTIMTRASLGLKPAIAQACPAATGAP
jgi:hypothetical protein